MTEEKTFWNKYGKPLAAITGGAALGALTGAAAGSTIPGIGTVAGGVIGAIGGGLTAISTLE